MERTIMPQLLKWRDKKNRKPLIIRGARQVGKTWIMKEFGSLYFDNVIYINFDNNEKMKFVFEMDYDIKRIMSALEIESGCKIQADNTLLIFDEIQEVPKALSALKYFCENAPEYAIVAAGSLLGVALHEGTSFPVGKVDFIYLYPLSYKEFLMACGEEGLAQLIDQGDYEMINAFSSKYADLLRKYYFIGGMPEVVQTYLDTNDMNEVRIVQENLLDYYSNDFSKHAPKEVVPRIQMVWDSIPMQLAKENKKFIYGSVREGARAKDFEMAIQWLKDCGLIHKCQRIKKPVIPLKSYIDMPAFKMYFIDVGLLAALTNLDAKVLLERNKVFEEFKGALTEQFVAQELSAYGEELYYYSTENSTGEIDFLLQKGVDVVPIEVKAEENLQAKSLRAFCDKYEINKGIRSSMSNYREQDWMINVPLYALAKYIEKIC